LNISDLKKEIDELYEKTFRKDIIKSLKNIRTEIVEDYVSAMYLYYELFYL